MSEIAHYCKIDPGGPLAVTDANLVLGRLILKYFPHIFGETEDQPLDIDAARLAFRDLTCQVSNRSQWQNFCTDTTPAF